MNFGFTEEQDLLRTEVRKFLDENAPLALVRKQVEMPGALSRELWKRMGDLGWIGLTVPEAYGGVGMDLVTLVVLLEETGRTLFSSPLLSTVLAAAAIESLGTEAQKARWLPGLAAGTTIGTLALLEESDRFDAAGVTLVGERDGGGAVLTGKKCWVPDAEVTDLFVVAYRTGAEEEDIALAIVEKGQQGVAVSGYAPLDLTKPLGEVELRGVRVEEASILGKPGAVWSTVRRLIDTGAVLVSAEAVGAAEGAIRLTADYARQRMQFGSAIGRFQGVKHPMAEMHVDVESVKSLVYYAAWALDEASPDAAAAASRAKAYASEAFARIGIDCIQLHGAIGYTWEYDIQLYLKRSKWMRAAFGDADYHYERLAAQGGL